MKNLFAKRSVATQAIFGSNLFLDPMGNASSWSDVQYPSEHKRRKPMKRLLLLLPFLLLLTACSGPSYMIDKEVKVDIRTIRPDPGKSGLLVARTTSFGGLIEFDTFLDRKMIGVTKGRGYFIKKDVEPGLHYLVARAETHEAGKIIFEPDTMYYIHQSPRMGWWRARITLTPVTTEYLINEMDESCHLLEYDSKNPGEDLTEQDYKETVIDYDREVTEGMHKEFTDYKGVKIQQ